MRRSCSRPRSKLTALFLVVCRLLFCLFLDGYHILSYIGPIAFITVPRLYQNRLVERNNIIFFSYFLLPLFFFCSFLFTHTARITRRRWKRGSLKIAPPPTCSGSKRLSTRYHMFEWMCLNCVLFDFFRANGWCVVGSADQVHCGTKS